MKKRHGTIYRIASPFEKDRHRQVRFSFIKVLEAIHRTTKRTTTYRFLICIHCIYLNDFFRLLSYLPELLLLLRSMKQLLLNYRKGILIQDCLFSK